MAFLRLGPRSQLLLPVLLGLCYLAEGQSQGSSIHQGFSQFGEVETQCLSLQFRCRNGQCIERDSLCDGQQDCRDGSDENKAECDRPGSPACHPRAFRCSYGACVDGDMVCNGRRDCADGSDELDCPLVNADQSQCRENQFRCRDGQCVASTALCDGAVDCYDRSDETVGTCSSFSCPQYVFRCQYGACIDRDLKCNGQVNCADGSDEDPKVCSTSGSAPSRPTVRPNQDPFNTNSPRPTARPPTSSPGSGDGGWPTNRPTSRPTARPPVQGGGGEGAGGQECSVPEQPRHGEWKLEAAQCANGQECRIRPDVRTLQPGSQLVYKCDRGYRLNGTAAVFCGLKGQWSKIPTCIEIRCPSLSSASTDAKCTYEENWVSCDSPVLPKTIARLSCRNSYSQDTSDLTRRDHIKCNAHGEWEPKPIKCVSVCGISSSGVGIPLIVNGTRANISDFPWHSTLYRNDGREKKFICGATIIKDDLLITAAHCVYDEVKKRVNDPQLYNVAVGNVFRDYDYIGHDLSIVKKASVKNIFIDCKYLGLEGNYASDIAIIQVHEAFTFSSLVMPVCLDLTLTGDQTVLEPGNYGKVAGFGRTAKGESSFILQSLWVPYISLNKCKSSSVASDSERYITIDKFCAGYSNGSSVCDGDSGGGLVFATDKKWYLRGIVSVGIGTKKTGAERTCDSFAYSLYTRVSSHMEWIQDIILRVETNKPFVSCH